jgi:Ser/Thr protein kinase RdoA (MazF antagonist)
MKSQFQSRISNSILNDIAERYSITEESLTPAAGFMNIIIKCQKNYENCILRISHSSRRSAELINAEIDWINYLQSNGVSVAAAILSNNTLFVESVSDGHDGFFLATLFTKAQGRHPDKQNRNAAFFLKYGQYLGKMHSLSKTYSRLPHENSRPDWCDPIMLDVVRNIQGSDSVLLAKCHQLVDRIKTFPMDNQSYGLIHHDAHTGNLFIDVKGKITAFDFDDCTYSWFINDIAIIVFYASLWYPGNIPGFIDNFIKPFIEGYSTEATVFPLWCDQIPDFLKLREMDLYTLLAKCSIEMLDKTAWADFMKERRQKILDDQPFLDIDFSSGINRNTCLRS